MENNINVNDRVVCINAHRSPHQKSKASTGLVKGRDYIVYGQEECTCCKSVKIDVGLTDTENAGNSECVCGHVSPIKNGIDWKAASRFRKKEETREVVYNVSKVVESVEMHQN